MLSFEKTYKTLIKTPNLFISEKIEIDDTKDVYGYSLKTFIPEELAYFESYVDAVIRDAEKNKEKLISSKGEDSMMNQYGIMLSIVNDQEYVKARQKISSQSLMKIGLREFYDPSLIDMGVPSLRYVNGQFFLKFRHNALTNPNLPTLVEESEWKNVILENIKFFVTDSFYTVLDCVDQQNNPLSKDLTEFFQWRENKIQFTKLTKKLPELDGVFENKKETKTYIFEAFIDKSTNPEINKIIHELLLKCIGLFNIYFHILGVVKEEKCFVFTLPVDVYMDSKATLVEGIFEELRNTFMSYFSQEHKALLKGTEKTNSVFFSLPKVNFNWTEKKIHDLQTKLPELKGIFETLTDNEDYQFIATFEPTSGADHKRLLTILKDMTEIARAVNQNFGTKQETVNVTTNENGQVVYSMENPVKWDFQTEVGRNSYARAFNNSYKAMASQFNLRANYTAKFKNKYEDLAKKLPELKGIFESTVTNFGIEGFTAAPKKGKFQIGDLVKVVDPENRWHLYQSKKSSESLGQVAEIIGYKGVPGAYTKYAIKLPNGNIYGIHSHLLRKLTEEEIKFGQMVKKLPELEGVFESKNEYVGFLKLTFKNISKEDMDILLKYGQESMEPHLFEIKPVSDSSMSFIEKAETEEAYEWFIKEIKNHLFEYKHSLASSLYNAAWTPIKNFKQAQAFVKRIFKDCEAKVMRSEYENLVKKLPELEGVFEHIENEKNQTYVLTVTFKDLEQNDKYMLEKLLLHRQKTTQYKSIITKTTNTLTYVIIGLMFEVSTSAKDQFERLFRKDIAIIYPNLTVQGSDQFLARIFKHFKYSCVEESIYHLTNKLPELKGMFESTEKTEEEFYYTKEETQAIEEIAEVVQKLVQSYEERLTALMKSARIRRISLQDSHFNKYIAVTHLRNDLRLQIGKICKKHFQDDVGNKFGNNFYVLYERIFNKPLKGLDEIVVQGGVAVMLDNDGVFEIDFDTYDYQLNEIIIPAKLIEPIEIKNFLKRLYAEWIKATFLKRPLAFPKMYLELRQEKLKYNKLKQKLPELEDIF